MHCGKQTVLHRDSPALTGLCPASGSANVQRSFLLYDGNTHARAHMCACTHKHKIFEQNNNSAFYCLVTCRRQELTFAYQYCVPGTTQVFFGDLVSGFVPATGTAGLNITNLDHPRKSGPYGHIPVPSSFSSNRA